MPEGTADRSAGGSAPALSGFRVVDLSTWIGGAYCTKLLADGGAEVIKVESSDGRSATTLVGLRRGDPGRHDGALFNFLGASKRSVVIDGTDTERSRRVARAVGFGRRRRLVTGLAAGGAAVAGPARVVGAPIRT